MKKVCVFVDGENLRHTLVELFPEPIFYERDHLPKEAVWDDFFDWIANEAVDGEAERIRTYWYVVQNLDCSPFKLSSLRKDLVFLEKLLMRNERAAKAIMGTKTLEEKAAMIETIANDLEANQDKMERRFDGWTNIHNAIAGKFNAIEFRRAGSIRYDLFSSRLGSEKAVDVKLATDMLKLKDIYDVAVIVSGDQDYVPAVEAIKDYGKHVVNVAFKKEDGKLLPGGAQRLNHITDWSFEVEHADLKNFMHLRSN